MDIDFIIEPFSYQFMVRSMMISILVGITLPLIGSFVINRNLGFMGDAIAHASLPILVIGSVLGVSIFLSAIPAAIIIALLLGYIISKSTVGEDTAIGIIFSTFFEPSSVSTGTSSVSLVFVVGTLVLVLGVDTGTCFKSFNDTFGDKSLILGPIIFFVILSMESFVIAAEASTALFIVFVALSTIFLPVTTTGEAPNFFNSFFIFSELCGELLK